MIILYIIGLAWLVNLLCWRLEWTTWLEFKEKHLNYTVLKCPTCSGFWLSLPINLIWFGPVFGFLTSLTISFVAALMENKLLRFN